MQTALVLAGLAMGVAASPHCVAMCGAPCAALTSGCRRSASGFHVGRLLGYMAGGAVAAGSVSLLAAWSQSAPVLRPLWMLLHLAFFALGAWWLLTGRQPDFMKRGGAVPGVADGASPVIFSRALKKQTPNGPVATSSFPLWGKAGRGAARRDGPSHAGPHPNPPPAGEGATTFLRECRTPTAAWNAHEKQTRERSEFSPSRPGGFLGKPWRASLAGTAWVAWPCGALQAALLLAALANTPQGGALVMAAFAIGSMPALAMAPWLWTRWQALRRAASSNSTATSAAEVATLGFRVAGAGLLLASGWVLTHGLWQRFAAWCGF